MTYLVEFRAVLNTWQKVYTRIQIDDATTPADAAEQAVDQMKSFDNGTSPGFGWDWWDAEDDDHAFIDDGSILEYTQRAWVTQTTEVTINLP